MQSQKEMELQWITKEETMKLQASQHVSLGIIRVLFNIFNAVGTMTNQ
jgi:hypothetical protein